MCHFKTSETEAIMLGATQTNQNVADTLPLYIWTILSLRTVSILSLTSFFSVSCCCAKSFEGGCVGLGMAPENLSLPALASSLFTSTLGMISGGLLTVWRESAETCWPSFSSSSSTQRRLATERGEVKERLDLFNLSFREELSCWWCCGEDKEGMMEQTVTQLVTKSTY